jgi:hypothetical protein
MKDGNVLVQCRFDLTDSEVAAAARKRAAIEVEIAKVESAFNVEREKHKKALGTLEGQAGTLADLIRKGYELRNAECRIEFDHDKGEVCTVRVDTGEVVKTRPMTDGERAKGPLLPLGPVIALDESDPDAQAAKAAEDTNTPRDAPEEAGASNAHETTGEPTAEPMPAGEAAFQSELVGKDCTKCGHLRTYHEKDKACYLPGCKCRSFKPATTIVRRRPNPDDVCLCGDLRSDHRSATGCDACDCTEFRDSDPLGVANVHAEPEKREAEL